MEVRRRNRGAAKRRMIGVKHLVSMLKELAETGEGLLQARRDEERREVIERRGLHPVPDSGSPREWKGVGCRIGRSGRSRKRLAEGIECRL